MGAQHTVTLQVRVYEELNDYLPAEYHKRRFSWAVSAGTSVAGLIRSLRVPASEVDLVLVNGQSVGLAHRLQPGDRVSLYPVFEAFDISPLTCLRAHPLRRPRFLVTSDLRVLARYLRLLGLDARCEVATSPENLLVLSEREGRIVLSGDEDRIRKAPFPRAHCVRAGRPREQAREVLRRLDLWDALMPLGRCPRCNRRMGSSEHFVADVPGHGVSTCPACGLRAGVATVRRQRRLVQHLLRFEGGIGKGVRPL